MNVCKFARTDETSFFFKVFFFDCACEWADELEGLQCYSLSEFSFSLIFLSFYHQFRFFLKLIIFPLPPQAQQQAREAEYRHNLNNMHERVRDRPLLSGSSSSPSAFC